MPRVFRRKYRAKKRVIKRRRRTARRNPGGFVKLVRKCPEILVTNNALSGAYTLTDPTSGMVNMTGTGVATGFLGTFDLPFAMKFSLANIINSTDLTTLCDKYMLKKTVIRIYYNHNVGSVTVAGSALPQCSYMVDYDDSTIPTTAQLREKMGCKIKYFNSKNFIQITVYPKALGEVYTGGVGGINYSIGKSMWLDSAVPNTEHYGLKGVLQNVVLPSTANVTGFKFDVTHTVYGKYLQ